MQRVYLNKGKFDSRIRDKLSLSLKDNRCGIYFCYNLETAEPRFFAIKYVELVYNLWIMVRHYDKANFEL